MADFEFEIRRKDGEVRTMMESSIAVRDAAGAVTAFQGFLLDITDRKRAEQEIRRRNRELMVLNSIAQTLTESMDLSDSLHRTLRQIGGTVRPGRVVALSVRRDWTDAAANRGGGLPLGVRPDIFRQWRVQPELLPHIKAVHATFLSAQGLPLPPIFRDVQQKEGLVASFVVILWSKDRVLGALAVGSRTQREFSPADINLLIAVGSQISNAIDRNVSLRRDPAGLRQFAANAGAAAAQRKNGGRGTIDLRRGARTEQSADGDPGLQPAADRQRGDWAAGNRVQRTSCTSRRSGRTGSCRTC